MKFKQSVVFFLLKTSLTEIRPWQYEAQISRLCAWIYHKTGTFEQKYEKMTIVTKTTNWSFVWIIFQGWQVLYSEVLEKDWKEKHDDWLKRFKGLFFAVVWNFTCIICLYLISCIFLLNAIEINTILHKFFTIIDLIDKSFYLRLYSLSAYATYS